MDYRLKKIIKLIAYPLLPVYHSYKKNRIARWAEENPQRLASYCYKQVNGRNLNWENPQDLSEKINWMKFYSDTSRWTEYADKYRVRSYVKSKGLSDILVKLYGVWNKAEDIDFDTLPTSFVLKTNHACGTVLLVKDKQKLDITKTRHILNTWLKMKMGKATAEPHYLSITPLIIAEEYLDMGNDLIDYKLHVIHGSTELIMVCSNRKIMVGSKISLYDKNWHLCPEKMGKCHADDHVSPIPCPSSFEKMKEYAKILCEDFPFVRMDFYEVNGKVYFGEMTFTPKGGYCNTLSYDEQLRLGKMIVLPKKKE